MILTRSHIERDQQTSTDLDDGIPSIIITNQIRTKYSNIYENEMKSNKPTGDRPMKDPIKAIRESNLEQAQEQLHNATGEYRKHLQQHIEELSKLLRNNKHGDKPMTTKTEWKYETESHCPKCEKRVIIGLGTPSIGEIINCYYCGHGGTVENKHLGLYTVKWDLEL